MCPSRNCAPSVLLWMVKQPHSRTPSCISLFDLAQLVQHDWRHGILTGRPNGRWHRVWNQRWRYVSARVEVAREVDHH